jgi:hypothetical protein
VVGESILSEAERLIHGDRNADYGPFDEDYGRAVAIYRAWRGDRMETAADGIAFMVCVKLSRMAVSPKKRDHYVDAAGYLAGLAEVIDPA